MISLMQETYTETRDVTDNGGKVFSCTYSLSYDPNTAKVFLPPPIKPSTCPFPIRPYFPIHPYIEKVYRQESSVSCDPNTNGKQTEELLIIEVILLLESKSMIVLQRKLFSLNKESLPKTDNLIFKAINKTAYVTYVPRIDKTGIKKIVTSDCKCKTISIQLKYFMKSDLKEPSALQSIPRSPWRLFSEYFFSPDVAGVDPTAPTTTSTTPIPLVCTFCPVLFSIVQSSSILNM